MTKMYQGKRKSDGEWIVGSLFIDSNTIKYYLFPDGFNIFNINDNDDIEQYEILPMSEGICIGNTKSSQEQIFVGDKVLATVRKRDGSKIKLKGIVCYSDFYKIYYINTPENKPLLFEGDNSFEIMKIEKRGHLYED